MPSAHKYLRLSLGALLTAAGLAALGGWWMLHRSLPQTEGAVRLPGLKAEVTVDRDAMGVPHIRAQSLEDLLLAQGYVVAQDRLWQMDLLRRAASGDLAEIVGEAAVEHDTESRTLGYTAAADAALAAMPTEQRAMLEAYARGVNAYIEQHLNALPPEFLLLRYQPRPWSARDTLLIAANLYKELTGFWKEQIHRTEVSKIVGPELANDLYAATAESEWDHPLAGIEPAAPGSKPATAAAKSAGAKPLAPTMAPATWRNLPRSSELAELPSFEDARLTIGGSNNFVVSGARTHSHKPLLENDTHLQFGIPSIWYVIHLTAPGWNVKGFTFPGGPLVVIGHNEHIAWGFTNNFADVLDVYAETLRNDNPIEYRVNGEWKPVTVRPEVIRVRGQADRTVNVMVTRHGPIIERTGERDGQTGYAIRWTATEPGGLGATYFLLGGAKNWDEFRAILRQNPGPAQNAVYADTDGHIGYIVSALIPTRRQPTGGVPVPGDTDEHEWTGYIPRDDLPELFDPPEGVIATANARVTGPGYKWHLTDQWMAPYRTARIYELLGERKGLRPEDCVNVVTDIYSYPHVFIGRELAKAREHVKPADIRTTQMVDMLESWDGRAQTYSVQMSFLEFTRRALLYNLLEPHLHGHVALYDWMRGSVFLEKVLRERPARWLPAKFATWDDLLIASADMGMDRMTAAAMANKDASGEASAWDWGQFSRLRMFHPLGREGMLRSALSIGSMPISGSFFSVKQIGTTFGPVMRFVADLSNLDNSLMNVTTGESGHFLSPNYKDQFRAWYDGGGIPSTFTDAAEQPRVAHRLRLLPAP